MSQSGLVKITSASLPSDVPISFDADLGSATAILQTIEILGVSGVSTSASGNTVTIDGSGASTNKTINEFDDFTSGNDTYKLNWYNYGSNFTPFEGNISGHDGVAKLSGAVNGSLGLGYTSGGQSKLSFIFGSGILTINWVFKFSALSNGTDDYTAYIGMGNNFDIGEPSDGAYLKYNHSVNSGNWVAVTADGGTRTTSNSTTAVDTNWVRATIAINADASSVSYYINDVEIVTAITTNITSNRNGPQFSIIKNAGTLSDIYVDLFYYTRIFTTAR